MVVTMSGVKLKRVLQTVSLVAVAAYTTLLVYQTVSARQQQAASGGVQGWQDRAPRSVSKDYDAVANSVGAVKRAQTVTLSGGGSSPGGAGEVRGTVTSKPPSTVLQDLFISVKTTRSYHKWRLPVLLKTWFQLAKEQTWFFTDSDDLEYQKKTNGHMVNTNCSSSHNRKALCCKMSVEFDFFLESNKKWFCHFDDDNYVNIPRLVNLLGDYNPQEDWYLGKPSIRAPLEILNRDNLTSEASYSFLLTTE